ncbi:glutathione S-transferase family protein [Sphingomonas sanguinis]|jgi:glutathione S-transferase|uniref:Glutathione S-transferase family protein n=1 Tax=Sphingomonas sanguinis TaxID=33051 RepID=A0A7Y7URK4_9SPHN|nr:glutathione S-transferase family protein [Sphingomonas sanguinis]MBZ6382156.1 glutathione S-transferase family protein [Sphingomonas sanguinis]NNG49037.1 glutathione S-transferase family protein [Sphingomonas sanguinis]NNG52712.1 glutathione S-transferase family protein [Sphingomonas sanguinis]NVP31455.1 glutathione S-transferase family protein [Sphingomonas sanguinis]
MTADLTLYTNPQSRGRIARWMLEETGAAYDAVVLDYRTTMVADDYRAINPMMKVPAIVHGGRVVTETAAICAYLAEVFPDAELAPLPSERAAYYRWLFFAAGPLEAAVTNKAFGVTVTPDQQRMAGYGDFDRAIGVIGDAVAHSRYIAGDRFTAADVYVGSQMMWFTQFGLIPKTDAIMAYIGRLHDRPAHRRATALDDGVDEIQTDAF